MNSNRLFRNHLKPVALAMALGTGSLHAQAVLEVGDTFSLFNLAGGSTLTGAIGSITVPPLGTWDTSNLATNGTITFAALPPALTWNLATGGDCDTTTESWTKDGGATTTTTYADVTNVIFDKPEGGVINGVAGRSPFSTTDYQVNLANLIGDLRAEFGRPGLPVAIATSGMDSGTTRTQVEIAQLAVANPVLYPAFGGNVFAIDTRAPMLWRDPAASPFNEGFHWNRNGETYFLIGDSMGQGMVDLLDP